VESLVAVGLGVLLAVGVSASFSAFVLGWRARLPDRRRGERRSTADHRRDRAPGRVLRRGAGRHPHDPLAEDLGRGGVRFAVLFADTVIGLVMMKVARQTVRLVQVTSSAARARRSHRSQPIIRVSSYFRRLSATDQQAALALLKETSPPEPAPGQADRQCMITCGPMTDTAYATSCSSLAR
jgi:hypothetical protein